MNTTHSSLDSHGKFTRKDAIEVVEDGEERSDILISDETRLPAVTPQLIETLFKGRDGNTTRNRLFD